MRNTWKSLRDWGLSLAFFVHAAFTVFLLASCRYVFLANSRFEGYLGLASFENEDDQVSYRTYQLRCGEKDPLCPYVGQIAQAGAVLMTLLCASGVVEVMGMLQIWTTRLLLVRAVKEIDAGKRVSWWVRAGTKAGRAMYWAVLTDPLILLIGLITWVLLSDLDSLSGHFRLSISSAFVCLTLKTALSLAVSAIQVLFWLESQRRNSALLRCDSKPAVVHTDKPCGPALTCED